MKGFIGRSMALVALACALPALPCAHAQQQSSQPLPLKPDIPNKGKSLRLILKDGSYQIVRQYEIVGDRVRYISSERGGDWEELPVSLVDWDATRKWERDHAEAAGDASPAMKEAEEIDKEEEAERTDQKARMPEVAPGLELPDEDSVFVLDTYHGTPELVELLPNELATDARTHKGLSVFNPLAGRREAIELPGARAKVNLHVDDPAIYLSLNVTGNADEVTGHAITMKTGAADAVNGKHGAYSAESRFAIVRVDERRAVRIVHAIRLSPAGAVLSNEDVIPAKVEVLPGKHWLKVTPAQTLAIGQYALVEIISPTEINEAVWDFAVDPRLGDNPGSLGPILSQ
jgi:hypothetical protein